MRAIAITPGEPAGIGPDLVIQLAQQRREHGWVVICDRHMLAARAAQLGLTLRICEQLDKPEVAGGALTVLHTPLQQPVQCGVLEVQNAAAVMTALDTAIAGCLNGQFAAMVTGPLQKSVIIQSGLPFSGHTEYLAAAAGVDDVVMLLVADTLRVALATTHLPLREVPDALTTRLLTRRLRILHQSLLDLFGIPQPTILVAGVNPHAGEDGHMGREEIDVIRPVCDTLREQGANILGPLPADTLFTPTWLARADAVLAMYHDQGLPVLKNNGFGRAVNITLGLPFVRTSVDHGTALDLAGSGHADTGSLAAAIELAASLTDAGT